MLNIDKSVLELAKNCEESLQEEYKKIDSICYRNSLKVLEAFNSNNALKFVNKNRKG